MRGFRGTVEPSKSKVAVPATTGPAPNGTRLRREGFQQHHLRSGYTPAGLSGRWTSLASEVAITGPLQDPCQLAWQVNESFQRIDVCGVSSGNCVIAPPRSQNSFTGQTSWQGSNNVGDVRRLASKTRSPAGQAGRGLRRPSLIRPIKCGGLCLFLAAILFSASPAAARADDSTPGPTAGAKIINKPDAQVPLDLQFVDESGHTVKLGDYFQPNRPVLLIMVYFGCPQLCSLSLNGLTQAVRKIDLQPGKQFEIVTVSFNPQEDHELAAAKKANYIKSLGKPEAAAGWHFLTSSDPSAAKTLGDAIGFGYRLNPETGQYLHEAGLYVCTPEGRVSRVECGIQFDAEVLRDSLIHASEGKISSGLFGVALACGFMNFDAQTGKYTWAAMTLMRVTGIATLILLAAGIGWMVYRESKKKPLME